MEQMLMMAMSRLCDGYATYATYATYAVASI